MAAVRGQFVPEITHRQKGNGLRKTMKGWGGQGCGGTQVRQCRL